ncbi:porin family protein [Chitinophaga pendula]|uniref:OmpW family outer membrane protein n=1 Tax=Chitinophaga TaxID=79328 RepID=UPI000BB05F18|nr:MULTISPECIES: OmpW family outer membrane protein [Chitinophaga]ASZ14262.1 hypothetical protein CK934_26595 [Chitinophaga sp. MD30]UCJ08094.1 porin family protein [Chitinophaga pendula]
MKSIKNWILLLAGCLGMQAATAQVRSPLSVQVDYSIAQPLGSLKDYANKTSFRGWRAGLQYSLNDRFSVGLRTGYQDYYERLPRAVYPDKSGDISAVQTRTLQVIPILATAQYQLTKPESAVIPYVGIGIGGAHLNYEKYWGQFVEQEKKWAFQVAPEVGVNIPFGRTSPLLFNASVQYNYSPYNVGEITSFNAVQANVGLRLHIN